MQCPLVQELSKLRKISSESVSHADFPDSIDDFKQYLHVVRPVEEELINKLRALKENVHKRLFLLCGSAGDGKSHLLAYLKKNDVEQLLSGYTLYNDATESGSPSLTAIDTLAIRLAAFSDECIDNDDDKSVIIAINLGMLNAFVESDVGKEFSRLREYIELNGILSEYGEGSEQKHDSVFCHVSFSDYQMFSLTEEGAYSPCLEELFSRIFTRDKDGRNRIFKKYIECDGRCTLINKCPVRHNFDFMRDPKVQKGVIAKIIATVIKDKMIITMREILDFTYHIIVHDEFERNDMQQKSAQWIVFMSAYFSYSTPMLLYEYDGISQLISALQTQDVLKVRSETADEKTLSFYALDEVRENLSDLIQSTPYRFMLADEYRWAEIENDQSGLRTAAFKFSSRLNDVLHYNDNNLADTLLKDYLQLLYVLNTGRGNPRKLNEITHNGVFSWDGIFGSDRICIDSTNEKFYILQKLELKPEPLIGQYYDKHKEVDRFSTILRVKMKSKLGLSESVVFDIDFSLFTLLNRISEGYRPTIQDRNTHADFVSAIEMLTAFGDKDEQVFLLPKGEAVYKHIVIGISVYDDGYEFMVVED